MLLLTKFAFTHILRPGVSLQKPLSRLQTFSKVNESFSLPNQLSPFPIAFFYLPYPLPSSPSFCSLAHFSLALVAAA